MAQGILPYKHEQEKSFGGMTALAGLATYVDLAHVMGLNRSVGDHLKIRDNGQGFTDAEMVMSLVLLNLAGGDCVDDLRILGSGSPCSLVHLRV